MDNLTDWGFPVNQTFLIAGPCSAESEEQVMATARALADSGSSLFRAGLWKPRTRPGSFEGVGKIGLTWLQRVQAETGLPVCTEVATPEHVEACLEHGIDLVWIGARTTPNPFIVQELATALKGTDIPVLIKNPVSPDLPLWLGAIERMAHVGLTRLGAIHRGFSVSQEMKFRNRPNWKIPIELKRRIPEMPLLCDPSHICGQSDLIPSIAQEAMDLLYDGLMIEVHAKPSEALSDADQQLSPYEFKELISNLIFKREETDNRDFQEQMEELRARVDDLDDHLLEMLGQRMVIVREMGLLKSQNQVSVLQPHRWQEILAKRSAKGDDERLSRDFIIQVFQSIHEEAIRQQEEEN